jgi:hypothetical protein
VTLPRDNPILDFLHDGERKFAAFKEEGSTTSLLVVVWDDHIYERISTLVNEGSGLLTPDSFARQTDRTAETFSNVDHVIPIRHMNHFVEGAADDRSRSSDVRGL